MVAHLDTLIERIPDPKLRSEIQEQVNKLAAKTSFGLVFEEHRPETVSLPGFEINRGGKVAFRDRSEPGIWVVIKIDEDKATLVSRDGRTVRKTAALDELVVIREFGDPIFPGLRSTGKIERGGQKPFHSVINAENFHALQALLYSHRGRVDAIYIDPPYNTGAKDWKYNNDYVDGEDAYRHSKWLAFMERRLKLARQLLNPANSVLIATIDEKEVHRLGLLIQQIFPEARTQMVSVAINPAAVARGSEFRRADEYYFFVMLGNAAPLAVPLAGDWVTTKGRTHKGEIRWDLLRRSAESSARSDRPSMFYPLFVYVDELRVHSIGDPIPLDVDRSSVVAPAGTVAIWPIRKNGSEGRWRLGAPAARDALERGYIKLGALKGENTPVYYLTVGEQKKITDGIYEVAGRASDGSVVTSTLETLERRVIPPTQWKISSHDSTQYGSRLLIKMLPDRKFPFPKSLYAVEDALRFFVADKPNAVVVDFFAGSGTTSHAVMRLNKHDGGQRQSIAVTNNEVSVDEQERLGKTGLRPGDAEWEALGICDYITKPRLQAAITGVATDGQPIQGEYKFVDEFPMSDGFEENIEFFKLTYEDNQFVRLGRKFEAISPILWMRAGAQGERIDQLPEQGWAMPDEGFYGLLTDIDQWEPFVEAVNARADVRCVYIVTDSQAEFEAINVQIDQKIDSVRLYADYLQSFEINTRQG